MNTKLHEQFYRPLITNKHFVDAIERAILTKISQLDDQRKAVVDLLDARMP